MAFFALSVATVTWTSCGGGTGDTGQNAGGAGGASTASHMATGTGAQGGNGQGGGIHIKDGGNCSTCNELDADCGPVTDPKCGGVVHCGDCPAGKICGGGGPNKCGVGSPDGCSPLTCADQNVNCGQVGDGCGNTISCGSCTRRRPAAAIR